MCWTVATNRVVNCTCARVLIAVNVFIVACRYLHIIPIHRLSAPLPRGDSTAVSKSNSHSTHDIGIVRLSSIAYR